MLKKIADVKTKRKDSRKRLQLKPEKRNKESQLKSRKPSWKKSARRKKT